MAGKLNDTKLRSLRPTGRTVKLSDGDGLYAYMGSKSKSISWQMAYRFDGKQKVLTFGRYPEISLAAARQKCFEARQILAERRDPGKARQEALEEQQAVEEAENITFEYVAELWFNKKYCDSPPVTAEKIHWHLGILYQHLRDKPIATLERKEVVAAILPTQERGCIDTAHRLAQIASGVCLFAWGLGYSVFCGTDKLDVS